MTEARASERATRRSWRRRSPRLELDARREQPEFGFVPDLQGPQVDITPNDPALASFQSNPEPTDLQTLKPDSRGIQALREAGVHLVVPFVTQGELIGLLNLEPRLSEQEYSADDRKLLQRDAGGGT